MTVRPTEYGSRGIVGIGVPQANPTVEQEMFALRPAGLSLVTSRLTSSAPELEQRLRDYILNTEDFAGCFDDLSVDLFAVACTGSSYLLGAEAEQNLLADCANSWAIRSLRRPALSMSRCSLSAPVALRSFRRTRPGLPTWRVITGLLWATLSSTFVRFRCAARTCMRSMSLSSADALAIARELDPDALDAVLFTGTGMPTLGAIGPLADATGLAVMSSNLCLLSAAARTLGLNSRSVAAAAPRARHDNPVRPA